MKKLNFLATGLCLALLQSCGNDIASGSRKNSGTGLSSTTPRATGDAPIIIPDTIAVASHMYREKGTMVISYAEEMAKTLANTLPDAYRKIPNILIDDEGKNVTTRDTLGRPSVMCGIGDDFEGVKTRIADCSAKNADRSFWNGNAHGTSGEAVWVLVTRSGTGLETWRDNRTGMIWSDVLSAGSNWCKASGNTQQPTSPATTDCNALAASDSLCAGNISMDGIGPHIVWRLPTRNDYLQADLDGARFVLPNRGLAWTATINSNIITRNEAWAYRLTNGTLEVSELTSLRQVRCIGVPKP